MKIIIQKWEIIYNLKLGIVESAYGWLHMHIYVLTYT